MAIALGLVPSTALRAQTLDWPQTPIKPQTVEIPSSTKADKIPPKIRVVIPNMNLCVGQEYDIPVYLEISDTSSTTIHSFQLGFRFPDHDVLEPTGRVSDIYAPLYDLGSPMSSYRQTANRNLPDHVLSFGWYQTDAKRPLKIKNSSQLLFRFRVRYKKEGDARIDFVGGHSCLQAWTYSYFSVNADPGTIEKNAVMVPNYLKSPDDPDSIIYDQATINTGVPMGISIMPDTLMCIGNSLQFWANGGERYEWTDVSGMERPYPKSMDEPRDQNPIFKPQEPGIYTFQCKITDKHGCIGKLYTKCLVRDNTLLLDVNPKDAMVAKGAQATSSVTFGNSPDYSYKLKWGPASIMYSISELEQTLSPEDNTMSIAPKTKPLQKATWLTIDLKDKYCHLQTIQNINVIGDSVRGEMILNPPTVCIDPIKKTGNTVVDLKVRAHGGSGGPYHYQWSAENLENDGTTTWNPIFQTDANWITTKLLVYKPCVVRVKIIDFNGQKSATLTDTIRAIETVPVTLTLIDKTGKPTCELEERIFKAETENAQNPKFEWYINDVEVLRTTVPTFTSALKVGDKVHCVMKTDGTCITNRELTSQPLYPSVSTPDYMSALPDYGVDNVNKSRVGDKVSLNIAHRHTGTRFRLRWYGNDETLLYDGVICNVPDCDDPEKNKDKKIANDTIINTEVLLERTGCYDYYRAVITESDRPCLLNDSLTTAAVQNLSMDLLPKKTAQAGFVYLDSAVEAGICEGDAFYAYARGIKYLPKDFRLVWYVDHVNPNDTRTNAVAYYATPGSNFDNSQCGISYVNVAEYASSEPFYRVQNWVKAGFKVSLMEGEGQSTGMIHGGDSLYYRIETVGADGVAAVVVQSKKVVLKTRPSVRDYPDANFVYDKSYYEHCEGEVVRFFPKFPTSDTIKYTWYVGGRQVVPGQLSHATGGEISSEIKQLVAGQQSELKGDTLITRLYNGVDVKMRATNTYQCYKLTSRYAERILSPTNMYAGFRIIRQRDTMVCSGDTVALWAYGEPYRNRYGNTRLPSNPGVPSFLPEYENKILMSWAYSKEDLLSGNTIQDTTLCIKVAIDSAAFGDRSDDFNNPNAVVGSRKYYLRMTNYASGCTSYDSITVSVGYHRTPSIVITPEPAFPWCEGVENTYLKLSGDLWGNPDSLRIRIRSNYDYWYRLSRPDSVAYKANVMKPGTLVEFRITNPKTKSCNHQNTGYASVRMDIRGATTAYMRQGQELPEEQLSTAVCAGDEITIEGFGATLSELQAVSGKRLTVDQIIARLHPSYTYKWIDNTTGDTVGRGRFLTVRPNKPTTYTLLAQDTALRCAPGAGATQVQIAVKTDVNVKFFDPVLKKEVPLSLCDGSNEAQLSFRAYPTFFTPGAYLGFAIFSASDPKNPREILETSKEDSVFTVKFKPGDRLMYVYIHDTLACDGKAQIVKTVDVQRRPISHSFMAVPDTLLCADNPTRLRLEGAKRTASDLPAGSPSLKEHLAAQGIAGASGLSSSAMVYWNTKQDGLASSEGTSFTPLVNPVKKAIYRAWGYNEFGCIQTDSVRVDRQGTDKIDFKLTLPVDSVLCESDSLWFALDRYESSILSLFDSLVWKRIPYEKLATTDSGQPSGRINAVGVEILNSDIRANRLYAHVNHGDVVYVDGYVAPDSKKLCGAVAQASPTGWYRSNKIVVRSYKRPKLVLAQMEDACIDSTLRLTAKTGALHVKWLDDPNTTDSVRYEIKSGREDKQVLVQTFSKEKSHYVYTKVYAEAYNHPFCITRDSIEVEVKNLSDMSLSLSANATVCNNDPIAVRIGAFENVETWHWRINDRDMTFEDFESDNNYVIQDFLSNALTVFTAPLKSGDRVWAEGYTTARCMRRHTIQSDTIRVSRGAQPKIVWVEPALLSSAEHKEEGCAGDPLSLRWKVYYADNVVGMTWNSADSWKPTNLNLVERQDSCAVYEWVGAYPSTPKDKPSSNGLMKMQVAAYAGSCMANETIELESYPKDTLKIEIATTVSQICQGEEALYGLLVREHIDSVEWYYNGLRMKSGPLATTRSYTCRPGPGDRVWAVGYNRSTSACPVFNGLRSNDISVNVIAGGRQTSGAITAALSASADSVCGFGQPVYTLLGKGFDSVYWFANGYLMAVTNVNTGITTNPDVVEATWQRTPRLTAYGLDSVYAIAVRSERLCAERDSMVSRLVTVYRREMPQVKIEPRDASVWPGKDVSLTATGASRYVWWTDMESGIAGLDQTFEFAMIDDTVGVYVMGYEPAYNEDSLAGGAALRPAANAYEKFGCRNFDQVRVKPASASEGEVIIYIPNAVLLNSTRAADRVFKVFGERIASVEMRVFNSGGDLVFSKTAEDPVWNPQDATTGNYSYRLVITMTNGEKVNKNGWVSVLE